MLDHFCIFTKGGVLLWAMSFTALKGDPVNALIRTCLLEDRTGESSFGYTSPAGSSYTLKWTLNNGLGLVFVAAYQKALKLLYVEDLLERVNRAFAPKFRPECYSYPEFDAPFQRMVRECEAKAEAARRPTGGGPTPPQKQQNGVAAAAHAGNGAEKESSEKNDDATDEDSRESAAPSVEGGSESEAEGADAGLPVEGGKAVRGVPGAFDTSALRSKMSKKGGPGAKAPRGKAEAGKPASKKGKQARRWDDLAHGGTGAEEGPLDFTVGAPPEAASESVETFQQRSLIDVDDDVPYSSEEEEGEATSATPKKGGLLSSFVRSVSVSVMGTQALSRDDIAPALVELKKKLMERNVAEEIAEK